MNYAINLLSVIPMRKEPAHRSEMVSQLLFGEFVEIVESQEDFIRVKCIYDSYEGWVQSNQLEKVTEENLLEANQYTTAYSTKVWLDEKSVMAPMGTPVYDLSRIFDKKISYEVKEIWDVDQHNFSASELTKAYEPYINSPYLWGGKSVFGIDCSGFVQQVFKLFGIKLLRDAYLQATQGTDIKDLDQTTAGDLAFFQNEKGRITHVGIILEKTQIVHASGKVRIDTIDKEGILNVENGKRTHQLHSIKRVITNS